MRCLYVLSHTGSFVTIAEFMAEKPLVARVRVLNSRKNSRIADEKKELNLNPMRTVAAQRRENYLQIKQTRERREKKSQNWYTKIEQQFNVLFMQIDFGNFLTLTQILFVVCVHFWWLWPVFLMPELLLKLLFYCWPLHSIFFFISAVWKSISPAGTIFSCVFRRSQFDHRSFVLDSNMRFHWDSTFLRTKQANKLCSIVLCNTSSKNQRNDY